jgi:hypothetical protein
MGISWRRPSCPADELRWDCHPEFSRHVISDSGSFRENSSGRTVHWSRKVIISRTEMPCPNAVPLVAVPACSAAAACMARRFVDAQLRPRRTNQSVGPAPDPCGSYGIILPQINALSVQVQGKSRWHMSSDFDFSRQAMLINDSSPPWHGDRRHGQRHVPAQVRGHQAGRRFLGLVPRHFAAGVGRHAAHDGGQ